MPRANRRRRDDRGLSLDRAIGGLVRTEHYAGRPFSVRRVGPRRDGDVRDYRCPGCQQAVSSAIAHVVAWPEDGWGGMGGLEDRRHWHESCWRARDRRPPPGSYR
ncbi:hypothetical protein [Agilicoccus flavus]|uniref:hypothetical protein n=1 Tax=Agilicoccus flavus TaxID=2775968 RepID=UPI001CF65612|nr:hypothetical protein [Agilicoccus flavus]